MPASRRHPYPLDTMERTGCPGAEGRSLAWHLPSLVLLKRKAQGRVLQSPSSLLAVPLTLQISKLPCEAAVALLQGPVLLVQEAVAVPQLLQLFCRGQMETCESLGKTHW